MKPLAKICCNAVRILAEDVNAWAEGKGWNNLPTFPQQVAARRIAALTKGISSFAVAMEAARHGKEIDSRVTDFLTHNGSIDIAVPDNLVRKLSQIGLMHTELVEMTTGLLEGNQPDDHCPELTFEEAEMADLFIRALHYCGEHNVDIGRALEIKHNYNINRAHRHGDKLA
jgi:hypothetical protein